MPVKVLFEAINLSSTLRLLILSGREPLKKFESRRISLTKLKYPIELGTDPRRRLLLTDRTSRDDIEPMVLGIVPLRRFIVRFNVVSRAKAPIEFGILPVT